MPAAPLPRGSPCARPEHLQGEGVDRSEEQGDEPPREARTEDHDRRLVVEVRVTLRDDRAMEGRLIWADANFVKIHSGQSDSGDEDVVFARAHVASA